jgi:hypothetical protein
MGCGASVPAAGGSGSPPAPPPAVGPDTSGLSAWSTAEVAAWFTTLPPSLQPYAPQLAECADGALLAAWDDGLLTDAGVSNAYHRRQLLVARDHAASSTSAALQATAAPPAAPDVAKLAPAASPAPAAPAPADKRDEAVAAAKKGVHVFKMILERLGPMLPWPGKSGRNAAPPAAHLPRAFSCILPAFPSIIFVFPKPCFKCSRALTDCGAPPS